MTKPDTGHTRTWLDNLCSEAQHALRALDPRVSEAMERQHPGAGLQQPRNSEAKRQAGRMMRFNHVGEACAQGLYRGQALLSTNAKDRQHLLEAADEEKQHLHWCATRLYELGDSPSKFAPTWYALSFALGALVSKIDGNMGGKTGMSFVVETERQVSQHLREDLAQLPQEDMADRAVLTAMLEDEASHADAAESAGGSRLPFPIRGLMQSSAQIMKFISMRV